MSPACSLCAGSVLVPFLERRGVPVNQNRPFTSRELARSVQRGDLRLVVCAACGFLTNAAFDADRLSYDATYDNDQSWSGCFEDYLDGLINEILADGIRGSRVLEVGCGKGNFITRLCARGHNNGIGVDATYVGPAASADGRVRFVRRFFDETLAGELPDAVITRHVIEHVPDPLQLLAAIARGLGGRRGVPLYIETPELRWILRNTVIQDFFYEHCSYFTSDTLAFALRRCGFHPERVRHVFDGQYQWIVARSGDTDSALPPNPQDLLARCQDYRRAEDRALKAWRSRVASAEKPAAAWGAGAKGVTFLNLLDPEALAIDCIVDVNPRKQGRFLPGTGHAIVPPDALAGRKVRTVLLMNPIYEAEVRATLRGTGVDVVLQSGGPV